MKKIIILTILAVLPCLYSFNSYAQRQSVSNRDQKNVAKPGDVCGVWKGLIGGEDACLSLEMRTDTYASGDLFWKGKANPIYCYAEDMVSDDGVTAGFDSDYQYCLLEQYGSEVVGVVYMSLSSGKLKGIYIKGSDISPVGFEKSVLSIDGSIANTNSLEEEKWNIAQYMSSPDAYREYLAVFPSGKYANEAKGRMKLLEAFAAEEKGDHHAALRALDKADNHIPLAEDALELRAKAIEGIAYDRFALAETPEESIQNGIDFVNTFLQSGRRAEVSDKVAYLMASTPVYLAGTSAEVMLTYATKDETREYILSQIQIYANEQENNRRKARLGFNGGLGVSYETSGKDAKPVYGGYVFFSIGDYRNYLNFEMGLKYRYWSFVNTENASEAFDFHQLRLFVAPKFNLVRQKKSAFYMYIAPEASYGYPIDMHGTGYYETNTLTLGARAGIGLGRFEVSASYSYDYWPMVNSSFAGSYSRTMTGVALTFCFSGSGRKK